MLKRYIIYYMKYIIRFLFLASLVFVLASCESTDSAAVEETPAAPQVQEKQEIKEDSEYSKAISKLSGETVSINAYEADLAAIQAEIEELDKIMKARDFQKWQKHIEQESIDYWKNPSHLAKASSLLPQKNEKVKNLFDYFNKVFIPARVDHKVEHIRYIDSASVKAVEVKEDAEVVFYTFVKQKDKWLVRLPTLD